MLTLIESDTIEPVHLADVKQHIRMDDIDEDDALILSMIREARYRAERYLNRDIMSRTWDFQINRFPGTIDLPKTPVKSVTSVSYVDTDGQSQTLSTDVYALDISGATACLYLKFNQHWPSARAQRDAVTVRFVTGYDLTPPPIQSAIRMMVAELYNNRANSISTGAVPKEVPMSARYMLAPYRRVAV